MRFAVVHPGAFRAGRGLVALVFGVWSSLLTSSAWAQCMFLRGNIINRSEDAEPVVDLNDGVEIVARLFLGNQGSIPVSGCTDASDVNDNGLTELSDYVYLVNFRFNGGPPIPAPHPTEGQDTTPGVTIPDTPDPRFSYSLGTSAGVPSNTGLTLPLTMSNDVPIRGLQVALQYDAESLRIDEIITEENTILADESTEYIVASYDNNEGIAFIGALKDFATPFWFHTSDNPDIAAGADHVVAVLKVGIVISAQQGFAAIEFTDGIQAPQHAELDEAPEIHNLIILDGEAVRPELGTGGGVDIRRGFVRADSNKDSAVDISDPVYTLRWIFLGGPRPPCLDAADANNDTRLDLSDPIWTLNFLYAGGPQPSEPYPQAGVDPSTDGSGSLGCASDQAKSS